VATPSQACTVRKINGRRSPNRAPCQTRAQNPTWWAATRRLRRRSDRRWGRIGGLLRAASFAW